MINDPVIETVNPNPYRNVRSSSALCWKAIFGGTAAAIGIHILLTTLGLAGGLATFSPATDANPIAHFNTGAAIIWSLCALISLWFGALLAGRFSQSWHTGFVHGILVWSLTLIITVLLLSRGTGLVLGGGLKVLGQGLTLSGQAASSGAGAVAQVALERSVYQLNSFVSEAAQSITTNAEPKAVTRAQREIGFAVVKLFSPDNSGDFSANRVATIQTLVTYTQMSQADATTTVDGWIQSYNDLKAEAEHAKNVAEEKARAAAQAAAAELAHVASWTFFALLIGLGVSAWGGSCGAKSAVRHLNETTTAH